MTALPARYDTQQPSKGPYSTIVYIDGSLVVADDADGKVIANGVVWADETIHNTDPKCGNLPE